MKKTAALLSILLCSATIAGISVAADTEGPMSVGGFTLGTPIESYDIKADENYLKEVIVNDVAGYRKGFITYGTCDREGEIVRIKLKYTDRSQDFYEKLLKEFKKKFGSKPRYVGDSFNNFKAWKWGFNGQDGERITLVLQHNLKDEAETIGTTVKLSLPDRMVRERICYNEKVKDQDPDEGAAKTDMNQFIPN